MKRYVYNCLLGILITLCNYSCTELDLVQQDAASSGSWYANGDQFRQSINELYRNEFWIQDGGNMGLDDWTDDMQKRPNVIGAIKSGTLSSEDGSTAQKWSFLYKAITRANIVAREIAAQDGVLPEATAASFMGEVNFCRASFWSYLITHFGDVPFYEGEISIEESFEMGRTDKNEILQKIYEYYDLAAEALPEEYSGTEFATKGAAYGMKARTALYMGDYDIAAEAARQCMELEVYELHPDFASLFDPDTKQSKEIIIKMPRSEEFNEVFAPPSGLVPRNAGGYGSAFPSWNLLASFQCVDGLPIDESPLFDPRNPFKNRDPRCAMTIVPFGALKDGDGRTSDSGTRFLDFEYNPHPEHKQVLNYSNGQMIRNNDTRSVTQHASYNGLAMKKGITEDWIDFRTDPDRIIMRYAEVLLIYAEAKIELNQIDESVLKAINDVRVRAYKNSGFPTPEVTTTDQDELRYEVRSERRSELAFEGLRYMDLIRWRLADKVLSGNAYGLLNVAASANVNTAPTGDLMDKVVNPGLWFWGEVPEIDENGIPDFDHLYESDLCEVLNVMSFPERQYLWPIPADEILLNTNLKQNPGY